LERLKPFASWQITKYEQPFDGGKVVDEMYQVCIRLDSGEWDDNLEYGGTIETAISEALASPNRHRFVLTGRKSEMEEELNVGKVEIPEPKAETKGIASCDFCGKTQREVRAVIAGPSSNICDECIELCVQLVREKNDPHFCHDRLELKDIKEILVKLADDVLAGKISVDKEA